ncbi:MAG: MarR family transcriptional regulator [Desulfobacula sp.]|jgi:DNA-binding MarR family transcriptional regulator|uniref:MarR family winged helix-turn-helix transcriptional regulator n=1 Tax=Desulfobacula sp. TaxID=2593537 RepID=UPI001DFBBC8A|nr:MarR family transcriptional regulator [Desulfobacula sp.]MBT3486551.1 MarR family transcriptional regulator [Desulfobacula sp.]MBT3805301.1 MarR family transcriptional regulator [Desulfobacula sp.]MBT4025653.1 MarR family transcriptional regulator [Desulfobacula sp.]MBT4197534.1 MarR family transcriptional regulator [Desulfobacula sp.]
MNFPLPPDCPYYLISRATLAITSHLKKGFAKKNISTIKPAYLGVLLSLWDEDGLKANELGKRSGLEPSTMTGLLDRMEKDQLVKREPDPHDRRANRICLTKAGVEAEASALKVLSNTLEKVLYSISKKDIETTKNVLRTILLNCSKEDVK